MIVRAGTASGGRVGAEDGIETDRISQRGGLTQFGAYLQRLAPGASTGEGHWHSAEDEFLYVTEGIATMVDDDGAQDLRPGDAAVWRAGVRNAHHVENRSGADCGYVIAGARIARDVCAYAGTGRRQVNGDTTWEIVDADGVRIKGGDLPAELLDLPADWTDPPAPGARLQRIVRAGEAGVASGAGVEVAALFRRGRPEADRGVRGNAGAGGAVRGAGAARGSGCVPDRARRGGDGGRRRTARRRCARATRCAGRRAPAGSGPSPIARARAASA